MKNIKFTSEIALLTSSLFKHDSYEIPVADVKLCQTLSVADQRSTASGRSVSVCVIKSRVCVHMWMNDVRQL